MESRRAWVEEVAAMESAHLMSIAEELRSEVEFQPAESGKHTDCRCKSFKFLNEFGGLRAERIWNVGQLQLSNWSWFKPVPGFTLMI